MGRNINVILGGGKRSWLPYIPPERGSNLTHFKKVGRRLDGRNLIFEWMKDKQRRMFPAQYVSTRTEMLNIMQNTEYLLGELKRENVIRFHETVVGGKHHQKY